MLSFLISWLFIGWLSLVLGLSAIKMLSHLVKEKPDTVQHIPIDYILLFGFCFTTFLCSLVSLFSPIDIWVNLIFLLFGLGLHFRHRKSVQSVINRLRLYWQTAQTWMKLSIGIVCVLPLLSSVIEIGETDTWFYHSQSIQWIKEYPAVPGLGNIHGRFAFNSNYFVATAFYALLFSEEYVLFPVLSFFFIVLNLRFLYNIQNSIHENKNNVFLLNLFLLVFFGFHSIDLLSSTSTDVITCVIIFYIFFLFMESAFQQNRPYEQMLLWALVALSITFKLSSLFIVFLLLFTIPTAIKTKRFGLYVGVAVLIGLPFVARNIILSGYLLYPVPELDILSVDWKIPIEEVQLEKDLVEGWAKQPYGMTYIEEFEDIPKIMELPFGEWIKVWWPAQSKKWQAFMLLSLFNIPFLLLALYRKKYKYAIVFATLIINLLFWFEQAPQPRFAFGFLFFGCALVLALSLAYFLRYLHPGKLIFPIIGLYLISLVFLRQETQFTAVKDLSFLLYPSYQTKIKTETFAAKNFILNVPSKEPPASVYWCYNAPLPCTPLPKSNLMMRGKSFRQGFRVVTEPQ